MALTEQEDQDVVAQQECGDQFGKLNEEPILFVFLGSPATHPFLNYGLRVSAIEIGEKNLRALIL